MYFYIDKLDNKLILLFVKLMKNPKNQSVQLLPKGKIIVFPKVRCKMCTKNYSLDSQSCQAVEAIAKFPFYFSPIKKSSSKDSPINTPKKINFNKQKPIIKPIQFQQIKDKAANFSKTQRKHIRAPSQDLIKQTKKIKTEKKLFQTEAKFFPNYHQKETIEKNYSLKRLQFLDMDRNQRSENPQKAQKQHDYNVDGQYKTVYNRNRLASKKLSLLMKSKSSQSLKKIEKPLPEQLLARKILWNGKELKRVNRQELNQQILNQLFLDKLERKTQQRKLKKSKINQNINGWKDDESNFQKECVWVTQQ